MIVYGDGHVRLTVSDVAEILHKRLSAPANILLLIFLL